MHTHDYFDIAVHDVVAETDAAVSIIFKIPEELAETFSYRPGQFITFRMLIDGKYRHRCYSLASAPGLDEFHKVTVKRVDGGLVSNELCSNAGPGSHYQIQPPAGGFGPADLDIDLLFFAGGSGITPVLSILKAALAEGSGRIALIYANRDEASIIFRDELKALSGRYPSRLTVIHWLESVQGLPTSQMLGALVVPFNGRDAYICGPSPFMESASVALAENGLPRENIHLERFVSLPDEEPAKMEGGVGEEAPSGPSTRLIVQLDCVEHFVDWQPGQKMLDAMLEGGVDAPYSCRVGGCSACMCQVTSGSVTMDTNLVLDEADLSEGWVLACQARSTSREVSCKFP